MAVTILRVGATQKYSTNWDAAFGGKKASKAAPAKAAPVKGAKKKAASPKKKASAPKKKAKK
jgi:hypothetical protein